MSIVLFFCLSLSIPQYERHCTYIIIPWQINQFSQLFSTIQTLGTKPIAHIDHFTPEMLGTAELAEEVSLDGSGKLVKVRITHHTSHKVLCC